MDLISLPVCSGSSVQLRKHIRRFHIALQVSLNNQVFVRSGLVKFSRSASADGSLESVASDLCRTPTVNKSQSLRVAQNRSWRGPGSGNMTVSE